MLILIEDPVKLVGILILLKVNCPVAELKVAVCFVVTEVLGLLPSTNCTLTFPSRLLARDPYVDVVTT